ncbi:MAG: molybdate ABC transporter substrate-binding protein [Acidimicrobiales bacterium]
MVAALVLFAGCGSDGSGRAATTGSTAVAHATGTVQVLAASSLTDVSASLAAAFEAANPGAKVELTFDGSARLASEILEGVPADVLVAADEASVERVTQAGAAAGPRETVATNELQIVVPAGNPKGINGLRDLAKGVIVALCRPEVPCGSYARQAFALAGVGVPSAGQEDSVRAVLAKVRLGEADAGVVYRTDVLSADGVSGVDLAPGQQVRATYPATVLADAPNPRAASAFVEFLRGAAARRIFAAAGFGRP